MGKITILNETIKKPITLAGKMAGVAYGSDVIDDNKNYQRGLTCINDGHFRTLEFAEVYFTFLYQILPNTLNMYLDHE